jgi:sugar phosphate isomerase/epimerase
MINCKKDTDLREEIRKAKELELDSCQICIWDVTCFTDEAFAAYVKEVLNETGFLVTGLWAGWTGPCEWNFTGGPATIGLVPSAYRYQRIQELMKASDFAEKIGVNKVITHVGFLPENPEDPDFNGTVTALRYLCRYMKAKGQFFLFETGQETPVTMLRTIQAIGTDNLGINFDTANLMLYGKANSLDALDTFGPYVMDTHIKDGFYPTNGMSLGREAAVGEGKANVKAVIAKLDELGYKGSFTVEREISGEQQIKDIAKARDLIRDVFATL